MGIRDRVVLVSIGAAATALCLAVIQYGVPAGQPFYQNPAGMWFAGKAVVGFGFVVAGLWPYKQLRQLHLPRF